MPRRLHPTTRVIDAWRLVAAAVEAEMMHTARDWAARAVDLSGWDRYEPGSRFRDDAIFYTPLIPRGYGYFGEVDEDRRLLVHPDAGPLVSDWAHLGQLIRAAKDLGGGLIGLDEALVRVLVDAMTPPDDASEITAWF